MTTVPNLNSIWATTNLAFIIVVVVIINDVGVEIVIVVVVDVVGEQPAGRRNGGFN